MIDADTESMSDQEYAEFKSMVEARFLKRKQQKEGVERTDGHIASPVGLTSPGDL